VGLFPLTEIYQIAEDRLRGDRTLPVWLGAAPSFRFSLFCLVLGGIGAVAVVISKYPTIEAALLALYLLMILWLVSRWAARFDEADVHGNFHTIMRLYATLSLGFIGWIGLHLTILR
jgi:1,4-dihydroxy-2-naphthoate octaprenyltransferase